MAETLPAPVLRADQAHHEILTRVAFSRHLNPVNANEARAAFLAGAHAPPFAYHPLDEADEILARLDEVEPPRDHPLGALVGRCLDETRLLVVALRDRTAAAFDELARASDWYPRPEDLALRFEDPPPDPERADLSSQALVDALRQALNARGLLDWHIEEDPVMSARVLVDGAKRLLRVHPHARFRRRDLVRLVVHEIDVHAVRAWNGARQPLRCFDTGLPGSLATEEGLALVAEEVAQASSPGVLARQQRVSAAILVAREAGFREVYRSLLDAGSDLAWGVALRIKRGLGQPGAPGVYAKDSVYLRGRMDVRAWLDAGRSVGHLYVGKVGLEDPVGSWLAEGWVQPGEVPSLWG